MGSSRKSSTGLVRSSCATQTRLRSPPETPCASESGFSDHGLLRRDVRRALPGRKAWQGSALHNTSGVFPRAGLRAAGPEVRLAELVADGGVAALGDAHRLHALLHALSALLFGEVGRQAEPGGEVQSLLDCEERETRR